MSDIIARIRWGGPAAAPGHVTAGGKLLVVAHHSYRPHRECGVELGRERADMLQMHRYHAEQGWGGISYNFCVFQSGNVYEGRGWGRTGAHTVGRNSSSVGICLVIDGTAHKPSAAALEAFRGLIVDGVALGYIAPQHEVAPHDRFQQKDCPGRLVKTAGLLYGIVPPVERAAAITAMPTLRMGSGGSSAPADLREAVRELQRRLQMPDQHRTGYFGAITEAAVKAFQAAARLTADGIVGPVTWKALGA